METVPEISIVVPVYNMEKYLRECLDSIANQDFSDWECILVDDGSSDTSGTICDEYVARDSRFRAIHGANRGVSVARNIGLDACRGRYIGFVDSDDLIHPEMFQRLHELVVEHDADVAQIGYEKLYTTGTKPMRLVDSVKIYDRSGVAAELIIEDRMPSYLCIKLFRREIIDVRMPEGMLYEDVYLMTMCSRNIGKMVCAPDVLYSYRQRKGSITKIFIENRLEYVHSVLYRARLLREQAPESVTDDIVNRYIWTGIIRAVKYIVRYEDNKKDKFDKVLYLSDLGKTVAVPELKYLGLKLWFRAKLLLGSPSMLMRIIRIHKKSHSRVLNLFD